MPHDEPLMENTLQALSEELDTSRVSSRTERNQTLSYLETWDVIDAANRIFGYDGWAYEVVEMTPLPLGWSAKVKIQAGGVHRTDVGFCAYANRSGNEPTAGHVEMAIKGAVSDGLKRAFRTFGAQFGNTLYDRESPDRAGNQQRQPRQNQQGGNQNQQQQNQEPADKHPGISVDRNGKETLSGKAAGFRQYVAKHGVDWDWFLNNILESPTLGEYFDSGGNPKGALEAFQQYAEDTGIELQG